MSKEIQVDVLTLREHYPQRFQQEYWDWVSNHFSYDWWDNVYEDFSNRMAEKGVRVEDITFSLSYSQSDGAAFGGRINVAKFMEHTGMADEFTPLYLDMKESGAYAVVSSRHENYSYVSSVEYYIGDCAPSGIYSELPQEAWNDLVDQQYAQSDIDKRMDEFVRDVTDELYNELQEEYEYLSSEEQFIEWAKFDDVMFDVEEIEYE